MTCFLHAHEAPLIGATSFPRRSIPLSLRRSKSCKVNGRCELFPRISLCFDATKLQRNFAIGPWHWIAPTDRLHLLPTPLHPCALRLCSLLDLTPPTMTVAETLSNAAETVKESVGLGHGHSAPSKRAFCLDSMHVSSRTPTNFPASTDATREEMSAAKLPLAYRDSCAGLLIPLNKCRMDNYYLNWRCQVWQQHVRTCERQGEGLTSSSGRETFIREVPIRGVQATGEEDGRDPGREEWREEQLEGGMWI